MHWQWTISTVVLLATSGLSSVVAFLLIRRRQVRGISALAAVMGAVAYWCLVAGLESAAVSLSAKILFSKLEYLGSQSVAILFLIFVFQHSSRAGWMSWRRVVALLVPPLASISLVATNEYHRLVWTAFSPGPAGSNAVIYHHGIGFFLVIAVTYLYILVASAILIDSAVRLSSIQRRQSIACLVALVFPLAGGILYCLNITFLPGLNLPPLSFSVAGVILAIVVVPLRLFDIIPVARAHFINSMSDGIVVVDDKLRIVEVNPAARSFLNFPINAIGNNVERVMNAFPQIAEHFDKDSETRCEVTVSEDPLIHLDVRVVPLKRRSSVVAFIVVMRDISKRYQAEMSVQSANKRLKDQVREIQRLQKELRNQAIRDPLTALFNRRHLDDMVPRLIERAKRSASTICVVMFDIDHFKKVNDTYGHRAGDMVLKRFGQLLLDNTRIRDIPCRYGGEEFALIMPEAPLSAAMERAENLRQEFAHVRIAELGQDKPPTLSAGIAVFPIDGKNQDDLFRAADEALYRAKLDGRDCIRTPNKPVRGQVLQ